MTPRALLFLLPLLALLTGCMSTQIERGEVPVETHLFESWYPLFGLRHQACAPDDGSYLFLRHSDDEEFVLERYQKDFVIDARIPFTCLEDEIITHLIRQDGDYSVLSIQEDDDLWKVNARSVDIEAPSIDEPMLRYASKGERDEGPFVTYSPDSSRILVYAFGDADDDDGRESRPLEAVILNSALEVVDSFRITVPHYPLRSQQITSKVYPSNDDKLLLFQFIGNDTSQHISCHTYTSDSDAPLNTLQDEIPIEVRRSESTFGVMHILSDGRSGFEGLLEYFDGESVSHLVRVKWDFTKNTIRQQVLIDSTRELARKLIDEKDLDGFRVWATHLSDDGRFVAILSYFDETYWTSTTSDGTPKTKYRISVLQTLALVFDTSGALSQSVVIDRRESMRDPGMYELEGPFTSYVAGETLHLIVNRRKTGDLLLYNIDLEGKRDTSIKTILKPGSDVTVVRDLTRWLNDGSIMLVMKLGWRSDDWTIARIHP